MGNRVIQMKLKNARECAKGAWILAYQYQDHPELGDKFLVQACERDKVVAKLEKKL